jgi:periplasmic protein CpxP/Spy
MKCMKIAVALLAATLMTGAGFAQTAATGSTQPQDQQTAPAPQGHKGHKMPTADERLQHLTKKLNLTDDQQTKIKPILEQQQQQMQALRGDQSLSKEQRHAKFQEMHKDFTGQIRAQLNPDQQTRYDQMLQKQEQRAHKHQKSAAQPAA